MKDYYSLEMPWFLPFLAHVLSIINPSIVHYCAPLPLEYSKIAEYPTLYGYHYWIKGKEETREEISELLRRGGRVYLVSEYMNEALGSGLELPVIYPIISPVSPLSPTKVERSHATLFNPYKGKEFYEKLIPLLREFGIPVQIIQTRIHDFNNNPQPPDILLSRPIEEVRIEEVWRRTKIFILYTGYEETFSRVAYEALQHGIPTICSSGGNIPRILGDAGYYPPSDPIQWAMIARVLYYNEICYEESVRKTMTRAQKYRIDTYENNRRFISYLNYKCSSLS